MILAVLLAGILMGGMDFTILNVALPAMSRDLLPSGAEQLWIVDAYALTVAATLVVCSAVGDRAGRRLVLLAGLSAFGLASAAAALASAPGQVIAARAVQGLGEAMTLSSTVAIIRVAFPSARERALAYGLWTAGASAGAALGPVLGGLLVERFSWGAVFLVNVPIALLTVAAGAVLVPESRVPDPRRWDVLGAVMSILGLAGTMYALQHIGQPGGLGWATVVTGLLGVALLAGFVVRQCRVRDPLLDMGLFADRRFSVSAAAIVACYGAYTGLLFLLTQRLQLVNGYSPAEAGLTLAPIAVASAVGGVLAPRLALVTGNRWAVTGGVSLLAFSLLALSVFGVAGNFAAFAAAGLGSGLIMTLGADSMMGAAPPERAGEAGAVQETGFALGAGLGVAMLGIMITVAYQAALAPVRSLSRAEFDTASGSLSAALELAGKIPGDAGAALRAGARRAYESGFSVATSAAAVALLVLAVLVAILLRPVRTSAAGRPERSPASRSADPVS